MAEILHETVHYTGHVQGVGFRHAVLQVMRQGRWEIRSQPAMAGNSFLLDEKTDLALLRGLGRTGLEGPPVTVARSPGKGSFAEQGRPSEAQPIRRPIL